MPAGDEAAGSGDAMTLTRDTRLLYHRLCAERHATFTSTYLCCFLLEM